MKLKSVHHFIKLITVTACLFHFPLSYELSLANAANDQMQDENSVASDSNYTCVSPNFQKLKHVHLNSFPRFRLMSQLEIVLKVKLKKRN